MFDPANHVAEDALGIVVQLALNLFGRELAVAEQRRREDVVDAGASAAGKFRLAGLHISLVIVQRV